MDINLAEKICFYYYSKIGNMSKQKPTLIAGRFIEYLAPLISNFRAHELIPIHQAITVTKAFQRLPSFLIQ